MNNKKQPPLFVPGFLFSGICAGLKTDKRKRDMALIYTKTDSAIAGVFTLNQMAAAPVQLCRKHLKNKKSRLIIINSGMANAATGNQGLKNAQTICKDAANLLNLKVSTVFPCSTGKIGVHLPMEKIRNGLRKAKEHLHPEGFHRAANAICTTDAYSKTAFHQGKIGGKKFSIAVMAKGAGMICPNMATMLCFIATDLNISAPVLQSLLNECVSETLNALSVDGDTSTNDTVLMMANGMTGNNSIKKNSADYKQILSVLRGLLNHIAYLIASDGEGARRCFRINVSGTKSKKAARIIAATIANSPLVKTAVYGADPNWGRILCAVGNAGIKIAEKHCSIAIGKHLLFKNGSPVFFNEKKVSATMKKNRLVELHVKVGNGNFNASYIASDLSEAYVKFNSDYST